MKMKTNLRNCALVAATAAVALLAPTLSLAGAPGEFDAITDAVDFDAVKTGLGTVFGLIAVVYVFWKGGKMLISGVKGA